jgi:hypothetical protein
MIRELSGGGVFQGVMQLGWTVFEDIEVAIDRWVRLNGAGPFFLQRNVPMLNVVHRGVPRSFDHSCAIGQWGDMQIELMQQHCDNPSHLRDLSPDGRTRMASVSWVVPDLAAETVRMQALDFPIVMTGHIFEESFQTIWFDTTSVLGCYSEVFADHPTLRNTARLCREAAECWDGSRPIRDLAELLVDSV